MRAYRAAWAIGGACVFAIAVYLVVTVGDLPGRVPMQYDGSNEPTWYATRGAFYLWFLILWLGINGIVLAVRRRPGSAVGFAFVNYVLLLVFHLTYTQATGAGRLVVTPNQTVLLIAPAALAVVAFAVQAAVAQRRGSRPA